MSLAVLMFAQVLTVPAKPSAAIPRYDLDSETLPKMAITCDVAQRRGAWVKLSFSVSGGQAYLVKYPSGNLSSIKRTEQFWTIVNSDPQFTSFKKSAPVQKEDRQVVFENSSGEFLSLDGMILRLDEISEVRVHRGRWRQKGGQSFVGYCDSKELKQEPLSRDVLTSEQFRELTKQ